MCEHLAGWDYRYEARSIAPTLFEAFYAVWKDRIARARFPSHLVPLVTGQGSLALRLLRDDNLEWFEAGSSKAILESARSAVKLLTERFCANPDRWTWGQAHQVHLRHPLSNEATRDLFDVGPVGVSGTYDTVRNTGLGAAPFFAADSGAEYRLVVDLADPDRLWATQNLGQSGQPGSPHYADQFEDWVRGGYHEVNLKREVVEAERTAYLGIDPSS